ncbi:MAG: GtrA family protein [Leptospiraceae bacterium]|nr:GtrA family protein [Leptospiraceae bacterium]MDW7976744.1 GtrA family protein [Leptospiraceae bacterium]
MLKLFWDQFLKFSLVGVVNTLITLSLIYLFTVILQINYLLANGIGYVAGFLNSFFWNKFWTFRSRGKIGREFLLFLIVFGISYGFQFFVLLILVEIISFDEFFSQILSMGFYTLANFFLNKYMTFR